MSERSTKQKVDIWDKIGDTVSPATEQTQQSVLAAIQGLGGSTAPIEVLAEAFTLTQGSVVAGTYQDTHLAGGVYHTIAEDAVNGFDVFYEFDVPDGFTADHAEFVGRYQGSGSHEVNVYAYNWLTTIWDKISSPTNLLNHSNNDYSKEFDIIPAHTSTQGKIRIRILHETATFNAGHRLYVDHIDVYFTASGATRIVNKDNEIINPATVEKQDDIITAINAISGTTPYNFIQSEEGITYKYYGYASSTGWKIKRKELASGVWKVADGAGGYDAAWADKENKTYIYA